MRKENKKTFKTSNWVVECKTIKTRNGFAHIATLKNAKTGVVYGRERVNYLNRTWERFEYEGVIKKLFDNASFFLTGKEKRKILEEASNESLKELKILGRFLGLIDNLTDNLKEKNEKKAEILSAQFGDALTFPDNWDILPEKEKEKRLKGVEKLLIS